MSKKSSWLKWSIIFLVVAALGAGGWWYWKKQSADTPQFQTTEVTRGDLTQVVTATGQLNPVLNVQVGSQISGTIQKLFADYNSHVTNNQIVAQIEPSTYKANVQQATADLTNAKASLELAQVNERRAKQLFDNRLIPQADYDTTVANLHQAEAQVISKQALLDRAKVDLDRCTIYSPIDGIVISRNVDVGQTVAASFSAPTLFVIANDLTKMQIDANVAEADIGGVTTNQDVDFTVDAFPNRTFHGRVTEVRNSPITVQNVVSYDTVISVRNADMKLRPGMTANVSIIVASHDNVLKLPNAALRYRPADAPAKERGSRSAPAMRGFGDPGERKSGSGRPKGEHTPTRTVYVLAAGAAKPQPVKVKTGITDGITTEIVEGLSEGDKIVTAALTPNKPAAGAPSSPFGGGMRFR